MAPPTLCFCGECKRCQHREYMREWYHRPREPRNYLGWGSGGAVIVSCEWCEHPFTSSQRKKHNGFARFCSRGCKDARRHALARYQLSSSKPQRVCLHCGTSLASKHRSDAAYCSARCNSAAHHQARKASAKTGARQKRIDRAFLIERDGGRCYLCLEIPPDGELTIDHVVALARGGTHTEDNLRVACLSCNTSKRADSLSAHLLRVG